MNEPIPQSREPGLKAAIPRLRDRTPKPRGDGRQAGGCCCARGGAHPGGKGNIGAARQRPPHRKKEGENMRKRPKRTTKDNRLLSKKAEKDNLGQKRTRKDNEKKLRGVPMRQKLKFGKQKAEIWEHGSQGRLPFGWPAGTRAGTAQPGRRQGDGAGFFPPLARSADLQGSWSRAPGRPGEKNESLCCFLWREFYSGLRLQYRNE